MFSPDSDFKDMDALPIGIIIRPIDRPNAFDERWFTVALKISVFYWTVTGHRHVVRSVHLKQFADKWQTVYPSQLVTP